MLVNNMYEFYDRLLNLEPLTPAHTGKGEGLD